MNVVTNNKWIGQRTIRPDGVDKVTGRAAVRRRHHHARHDLGQGAAQPASACAHQVDRHLEGGNAAGREGRRHRAATSSISRSTRPVMLGIQDMRWMCRNVMAREKALFPGHPVAAVAATTEAIAAEACKLIEVDYEVLPWSIEIDDAIKPDAPILHEFNKFDGKPSNIAGTLEHKKGDVAEGFEEGRDRHRAHLHHAPGAPGLYRAACLPDQRRRRQQDHDLELEPGPVHGARHDGAI